MTETPDVDVRRRRCDGLEAMVAGRRRQEVDRRHRDAIERQPETEEGLAEAHPLAVESIHDEPWERWW